MPLLITVVLTFVVIVAGVLGITVFGAPEKLLLDEPDRATRLKPDEQRRILEELLPYAALSELAYDKADRSEIADQVGKRWKQESFVADGKADRVGLQYRIFRDVSTSTQTIALVFGGTQEMHDWYSNTAPLLRATLNRVIWQVDGDQPYMMGWCAGPAKVCSHAVAAIDQTICLCEAASSLRRCFDMPTGWTQSTMKAIDTDRCRPC